MSKSLDRNQNRLQVRAQPEGESGRKRILNHISKLWILAFFLTDLVQWQAARAENLQFTPQKDNTLYESNTGNLSNGAGEYLFVGKVAPRQDGKIRRALIYFDLQTIPPNAIINGATLALNMSKSIAANHTLSLHRVLSDWGEGASNANGPEGGGAAPAAGDATWIHTFFNSDSWASPGGDFAATASASIPVEGPERYTWGSVPGMVADVQAWVDDPTTNFGWLLKGNENTTTTTKRFDSRENSIPANRPLLTIDYTVPTADLMLGKSVVQPNPKEGETILYTVQITNKGPNAASRIEVTDILPPGVTFVSSVTQQGAYNPTTGVWDIGTLATAATGSLSLTATVDPGTVDDAITNTATVTRTDQIDPVLDNNSAQAVLTVTSLPKADINDDEVQDLRDVIIALQVLSKMQPAGVRPDYAESGADVDGDDRVGLAEAIFAIGVAAK